MNNYKRGLNQTIVTNKYRKWGIIIILALVVLFIIIGKINDVPRYEYLKDVFVSEAQIVEMKANSGSYAIRLRLINDSITLKEDQSWFEVNYAFYQKCVVNNKIGVLVGDFDVFKESIFAAFGNTGQTYEKSIYGVVDVFDSLEEANSKYPHKNFTADAQLRKKTTSEKEGNYFVLFYEDREMSVQVDNDIYNKYKENDIVSCDFDGIGDFVKIVGVK